MVSSDIQNQLLRALPAQDLNYLASHLEHVTLEASQSLEKALRPAEHAYFPETALASLVTNSGKLYLEAGMFGNDGMSGTALLMGDQSPFDCRVRIAGTGYRVAAGPFQEFLRTHPYSERLLRRYAQAEHIQIVHTTLSTGQTKLEHRVARWLLMVRDRVSHDVLNITQEEISVSLGVRRPGVTDCLHKLEGLHFLKCGRKQIQIIDRRALAAFAGAPYGDPEREYARLMGFPPGVYTPL